MAQLKTDGRAADDDDEGARPRPSVGLPGAAERAGTGHVPVWRGERASGRSSGGGGGPIDDGEKERKVRDALARSLPQTLLSSLSVPIPPLLSASALSQQRSPPPPPRNCN